MKMVLATSSVVSQHVARRYMCKFEVQVRCSDVAPWKGIGMHMW